MESPVFSHVLFEIAESAEMANGTRMWSLIYFLPTFFGTSLAKLSPTLATPSGIGT